jgi:hypothetical protein
LTRTVSPSVSFSEFSAFPIHRADDVQKFLQILRVKTDLTSSPVVIGGDFFARLAFFGRLRADFDFVRL